MEFKFVTLLIFAIVLEALYCAIKLGVTVVLVYYTLKRLGVI